MSNYLAIATVTEALRQTLETAVNVVTGAGATAVRPDQVVAGTPGVNVYLYHISPDGSLRNADLPTRAGDATLMQRPRAAIDLHYLLTVHGNETLFEPQRVLGAVVRALHDAPVLTKKAITDAAAIGALTGSDLGNAVEAVRFTPMPLSLEELSKLWSVFFQARYALSVAYQAALVVIEGSDSPQSPLPVRTRNIVVVPSLGPVIDRIASQAPAPGSPVVELRPIHLGDILHIIGHALRGGTTKVRNGAALVNPTSLRDDLITLELKSPGVPAGELRAGVKTVQVVHQIDFGAGTGPHVGLESNVASFILSPRVVNPPPAFAASAVTVNVEPAVAKGQRLVLMLNQTPPPASGRARAYTFSTIAPASGAAQTIAVKNVDAGDYLVRLQVDGAESPLDIDADGRYTGTPKVTVP